MINGAPRTVPGPVFKTDKYRSGTHNVTVLSQCSNDIILRHDRDFYRASSVVNRNRTFIHNTIVMRVIGDLGGRGGGKNIYNNDKLSGLKGDDGGG